jgi:hypothetical protein
VNRLAIHINDAEITALGSDRVFYREPGYALLDDNGVLVGSRAYAEAKLRPRRIQNRQWMELTADSIPGVGNGITSAAELVSRQLEEIWRPLASSVDEVVLAVPAYMNTGGLGLLLGIAEDLRVPVVGMVDSAVAATRREYREAVPVHIDVSLHTVVISRIGQPGHVQLDRGEILEGHGLLALQDAWLHAIAAAFVKQCRFDPLHTAESEQSLLNALPGWLADAVQRPRVEMRIEAAGGPYEAGIESLELVSAVAPSYQAIANKLATVVRAEEIAALQLDSRVGALPGLADFLRARVGGEVFMLEPGATARGALSRVRGTRNQGAITLLRQLPWDQAATDVSRQADRQAGHGTPTHLLVGHEAYALGEAPLVIGSKVAEGERSFRLPDGMAGVSRRHCQLQLRNSQCVVEDFSRYGTFLNGHRIDGSAVLSCGDILRVGSPGHEFMLITMVSKDGA